MEEREIRTITNRKRDQRVIILQRSDDAYTYRQQWLEPEGWGALGPACGIYDSADTAEIEARMRVSWMSEIQN
jgi:hypothetical protein